MVNAARKILCGKCRTYLTQKGNVVKVKQGRGLLDRAALDEREVAGNPGVDDGAPVFLAESHLGRRET